MVQGVLGETNGNTMEESWRWKIMPSGTNSLKISFPIYDEGGKDGWVDRGYLYIMPKNGTMAIDNFLYFYADGKDRDDVCTGHFKKFAEGDMVLEREGYSSVAITSTEKSCDIPQDADTDLFTVNKSVPGQQRL